MNSERLLHYRNFLLLVDELGPAALHDNERLVLIDSAEGLLLTDDPQTIDDMLEQGFAQLDRIGGRLTDGRQSTLRASLEKCSGGVRV
jgi:hypothetical protein